MTDPNGLSRRFGLARRVVISCTRARGPLLTRYYLLDRPWLGVYLHHLQTSDEDRAPHDHPWSFLTVLLTSGYFEWVKDDVGLRRAWRHWLSLLWRPAEFAHRLELVRPCWTLVFRFRRRRTWGYHTPDGWVDFATFGRRHCD